MDKPEEETAKHPAVFSDIILKRLDAMVPKGVYLDPFCGTGRVFELTKYHGTDNERIFYGFELEPEWADQARKALHRAEGLYGLAHRVVCGDSLEIMDGWEPEVFDGIVTSCVYGNRMSDHHNASDPSKRRSYTHTLGHKLTEGNIGDAYFWQPRYQEFHRRAWQLCYELTVKGGDMFLNVSDFIRNGERVRASQWHMRVLREIGYNIIGYYRIETPRFRHGENDRARVDHEVIIHGRKPL